MAIIKPNGTLSGRVGELVYQYQKGMLTVRQRPASYRDKKTEVQLAQREKMKAAQQLYRIVKEAVRGCFEFKKANQRDCDCFMSANILELGIVSQGTLPTLGCRFEDCHAVCDIIQEDWKEGDVLRFVRVENDKVKIEDKIINSPLQDKIEETVEEDGFYCWIHIRQGRKYTHVSTQKLCKNTPKTLPQVGSASTLPPL